MDNPASKKRILILGGGFAGAYTAKHLEKRLGRTSGFELVLVAKENFILFTPMLHEVAGADLAVTDIVQPLRKVLRHTRVAIVPRISKRGIASCCRACNFFWANDERSGTLRRSVLRPMWGCGDKA